MKEMREIISNSGFWISRIKRVGSRLFEKMLDDSGIDAFNGAQGRILFVLWQEDNVPITRISELTGLAKTTLTSMLDRMEASGLVRRVPSPNDRRQIYIVLTDHAKSLEEDYNRLSRQMTGLYFQDFNDDEIHQFESYLLRILRNLEGGTENGQDIRSREQ